MKQCQTPKHAAYECVCVWLCVLCKVSLCSQFLISWNGNGEKRMQKREISKNTRKNPPHTEHIYSKANKMSGKKHTPWKRQQQNKEWERDMHRQKIHRAERRNIKNHINSGGGGNSNSSSGTEEEVTIVDNNIKRRRKKWHGQVSKWKRWKCT